jgi:hypothetical protein
MNKQQLAIALRDAITQQKRQVGWIFDTMKYEKVWKERFTKNFEENKDNPEEFLKRSYQYTLYRQFIEYDKTKEEKDRLQSLKDEIWRDFN